MSIETDWIWGNKNGQKLQKVVKPVRVGDKVWRGCLSRRVVVVVEVMEGRLRCRWKHTDTHSGPL